MKKTLLATLEFPPDVGGVGEYLAGLFGALPPDKVAVLAPDRGDASGDSRFGFPVYRRTLCWGKVPLGWIPSIFAAWGVLRREKARILVISHILPMGYVALKLKPWTRVPHVVIVHGTDLKNAARTAWKRFWAWWILRTARAVVANSDFTARLAGKMGARNVTVIRPGLASLPDISEGKSNAKAKLGLETGLVMLSVGRLVKRKGFDRVIAMLPELRRRHGDVRYVIVGSGPEGPALKALTEKLGVSGYVKFRGAAGRHALNDYYAAADLFVLPARELPNDVEGFGMVCLEAAAFGVPVVATRVGGIPEAVADGETGLLADPDEEPELLAALDRALGSPELRFQLGEAGRDMAAENFDWKDRAAEFEALLG